MAVKKPDPYHDDVSKSNVNEVGQVSHVKCILLYYLYLNYYFKLLLFLNILSNLTNIPSRKFQKNNETNPRQGWTLAKVCIKILVGIPVQYLDAFELPIKII